MEYFALPPHGYNQPLVEHPFFKWLSATYSKRELTKLGPGDRSEVYKPREWLKTLGFQTGVDRLAEEDLKTLHLVEEHWWRCSPWFEPHVWGSLFSEVGYLVRALPNEQFFVTGPGRCSGYYKVTQKLRSMVAEAGWIYAVCPSTTYFEVIEGRLYAKYQQILGSRYICDISDFKEG